MADSTIAKHLKYANLQMAAEAFLVDNAGNVLVGSDYVQALVRGNTHASHFTETLAKAFADQWEVVDQRANTNTGFSGTLFRNRADPTELVMSFRSTEFIDDGLRDSAGTNKGIANFGWAFGQIVDMEDWYKSLIDSGKLTTSTPFDVTGYSLGGHLATVFGILRQEAQSPVIKHIYTFNGAGTGGVSQGVTLTQVIERFRAIWQDGLPPQGLPASELERLRIQAKNDVINYMAEVARVHTLVPGDGGGQNTSPEGAFVSENFWLAMRVAAQQTTGAAITGYDPTSPNYADARFMLDDLMTEFAGTGISMVATSGLRNSHDRVDVRIEDQPLLRGSPTSLPDLSNEWSKNDFGDTHSLVLIVDSLVVMDLLARLDTTLTLEKAANLLNAATAAERETVPGQQGRAEGDMLESVVDALYRMLEHNDSQLREGQPNIDINDGNTWWDDRLRIPFHEKLEALLGNTAFKAFKDLPGQLSISLPDASLATAARTDFAAFLTVHTLSPVALKAVPGMEDGVGEVLGAKWATEYDAWKQDRELTPEQRANNEGTYTDQYLRDRALMLSGIVDANLANSGEGKTLRVETYDFQSEYRYFEDQTLRIQVQEINAETGDQSGPEYIFGGDDNDSIFSGNESDHLYGGAGMDRIDGGQGNDYIEGNGGSDILTGGEDRDTLLGGKGADLLEGGKDSDLLNGGLGSDTYKFSSGDGWDTIEDSDGLGAIQYDGIVLQGGKAVGDSGMVWQEEAGGKTFTYILSDWSENGETFKRLSVQGPDGGLWIKRWQPGALGLTLADAAVQEPLPAVFVEPTIRKEDGWVEQDYFIVDGRDVGPALLAAVGEYGEVWGSGMLLGNDFANRLWDRGNDYDDELQGLGGKDILETWGGNDRLYGGEGDDALSSGEGDDLLEGGAGSDVLSGDIGSDVLTGGDGDDYLFGGGSYLPTHHDWSVTRKSDGGLVFNLFSGVTYLDDDNADVMIGGAGNDYLWGGAGSDDMDGGADDDQLIGDDGGDRLIGGEGDDRLYGDGWKSYSPDRYIAAPYHGDDYLDGGAGRDELYGDGGADELHGGDGDDTLYGDAKDLPSEYQGQDFLDGGAGNDKIYGMGGADTLFGGTGNDTLVGMESDDTLFGGAGDDSLYGDDGGIADSAQGNDFLDGGEGNDQLTGRGGDDFLDGGDGNDKLWGNAGKDTLKGGAGNDEIAGDNGSADPSGDADRIDGGAGDDVLDGEGGNDTLVGGEGADILQGGEGDDTYVLNAGDGASVAGKTDSIVDWAGSNTVSFGAGITESMVSVRPDATGQFLLVNYGAGDAVAIRGGATGSVASYAFADGTRLSYSDLIGRTAQTTIFGVTSSGQAFATGSRGDDAIDYRFGDALISGGKGNDKITASGANNTYLYSLGDGTDLISDTSAKVDASGQPTPNRVRFGVGIAAEDLSVAAGARGTLDIKVGSNPDDLIQIAGFNSYQPLANPAIDLFEFADGTVLTYAQLIAGGFDFVGTDGADAFSGTALSDRISGGAGNDVINAGDGADWIAGGSGADTLYGERGSDTYYFSRGDGLDRIGDVANDAGAINTLRFGPGITQADLAFARRADGTLYIGIAGSADGVLIPGWYQANNQVVRSIQRLEFEDGSIFDTTVLDHLAVAPVDGTSGNDVLAGTASSDTIMGQGGDDVLQGGAGSDLLVGGSGNDRYVFEWEFVAEQNTDTVDTIIESPGETSVIELQRGMRLELLCGERQENDLLFHVRGAEHGFRIKDYFASNQVWSILSYDGSVTTMENFLARPEQNQGDLLQQAWSDFFAQSEYGWRYNHEKNPATWQLLSDGRYYRANPQASIAFSLNETHFYTTERNLQGDGSYSTAVSQGVSGVSVASQNGDVRFDEFFDGFKVQDFANDVNGRLGRPGYAYASETTSKVFQIDWGKVSYDYAFLGYGGKSGTVSYQQDANGNLVLVKQTETETYRSRLSATFSGSIVGTGFSASSTSLSGSVKALTDAAAAGVRSGYSSGSLELTPPDEVLGTYRVTSLVEYADAYHGSSLDELLYTHSNFAVDGGGGNDWIISNVGATSVAYGGDGDDKVFGGNDLDVLNGGTGNDYLAGRGGNDTYLVVKGQAGHDIIDEATGRYSNRFSQYSWTWTENNVLAGSGSVDTVRFGRGISLGDLRFSTGVMSSRIADAALTAYETQYQTLNISWAPGESIHIVLPNGADPAVAATMAANEGKSFGIEWFRFDDGSRVAMADMMQRLANPAYRITSETSGGINLAGTAGSDVLLGLYERNVIEGLGGDDRIYGSNESDIVAGGDGFDEIYGADGSDEIFGNGDDDYIQGDAGDDLIDGGAGDDYIEGNAGSDVMRGDAGNDDLEDWQGGNDFLDGGDGDDYLHSDGDSPDFMVGGRGNEWIIDSYTANNVIVFNRGDGADTLRVRSSATFSLGAGIQTSDITLGRSDQGLVIGFGNGDQMCLMPDGGQPQSNLPLRIQIVGESSISWFDLSAVIAEFEQMEAQHTAPAAWNIGDRLLAHAQGQSADEAYGGSLAFEYARTGTLDGVSAERIRAVLTAPGFGAEAQSVVGNRAPVVSNPLDQQAVLEDQPFVLPLAQAFADADAADTLRYEALQADGSPLPAWLLLDPASGILSGTPQNGDVGSYELTVVATDRAGATASTSFPVLVGNVNDAPRVAMPIADRVVVENAGVDFTLPAGTFADEDAGDYLTLSATLAGGSPLPAWLTFDSETGTFSGSPGVGNLADYALRVTARDAAGSEATAEFKLSVVAAPPMALIGTAEADTLSGLSGNDSLIAGEGSDWLSGGAGNDTLDGGLGDDTYVYNLGDGIDHVVDGGGSDRIVLNGISPAQVVLGVGSLKLTFADGGELHLDDFDPDRPLEGAIETFEFGDGTVMSREALILSLGFHIEGTEADDTLSGTAFGEPLNGYAGNDALAARGGDDVLDGGDGDDLLDGGSGNDTLYGGAGNDAFRFGRGDGLDVVVDRFGANSLRLKAGLAETDVELRQSGENLVLTLQGGSDRLVVEDWFAADAAGWTLALDDGTVFDRAAVEARLIRNEAPVLTDDSLVVVEDGEAVGGNVLANDRDPEGRGLRVSTPGNFAGAYGSLALSADGSYRYTLDDGRDAVQALAAGQVVTERFGYTATDDDPVGALSAAAELVVAITGANDAPVIVADTAKVGEDGVLAAVGNVLANDRDVDAGSVLQVAVPGVLAGAYGSLTLETDGQYAYALANGSAAVQSLGRGQQTSDRFSFAVSDGSVSVASSLDVAVSGTNDAPVVSASLADRQLNFHKPFVFRLPEGSFSDIDAGDALDYAATLADGSDLPDWLHFDARTQTFSGVAPKAKLALDVRVTATDRVAASGSSEGSLSVSDVFRVSVSHGNEGVGNGEDAPPPGHPGNCNDGPGASRGNPGARDDHGQRDGRKERNAGTDEDDWSKGWGGHGKEKSFAYLDLRLIDRQSDGSSGGKGRAPEPATGGDRDFHRRWVEMDRTLNRLLAESAAQPGWQDVRRGADVGALNRIGHGLNGSVGKINGVDAVSLMAAGGTALKGFRGLQEGLQRLG